MKASEQKTGGRPVYLSIELSGASSDALEELSRNFFMSDRSSGKKLPQREQAEALARSLIMVSLANVEKTAADLSSFVRYCQAEGIEKQEDYLESLAESSRLRYRQERAARTGE